MLDCIIADDSQIMRKIIRTNLEKLGIKNISETVDGDETIYKFTSAKKIDLLFLDINMPVKNGIEVYETLRDRNAIKSAKIVIISAELFDESKDYFKENGIYDFIPKPFDMMAFNNVVKPLIEEMHQPRSNIEKKISDTKKALADTLAKKDFKATAHGNFLSLTCDKDTITIDIERSLREGTMNVNIDHEGNSKLKPLKENR